MPCGAVSPVPQGLALQGVSPVRVACAQLLSLGLCSLQSSCLQSLALPIAGSVWSPAGMGQVLTRCAVVCLGNETCPYYCSNTGPTTPALGDVVLTGLPWSSRGGWGEQCATEASVTRKGGSTEVCAARAWCKRVR